MLFIWIILYGLLFSGAKLTGLSWLPPLVMTGYSAALALWCCRSRTPHESGLCKLSVRQITDLWLLLPMLALPLYQLIVQDFPPLRASNVLMLLSAVLVEEIFFRGFLLNYLATRFPRAGNFLCAALFGLFHFGNLLTGLPAEYVLVQVLLATACGIYWGSLRIRFQSLLPCILAHALVNLTGQEPGNLQLSDLLSGYLLCCLAMLLPLCKIRRADLPR